MCLCGCVGLCNRACLCVGAGLCVCMCMRMCVDVCGCVCVCLCVYCEYVFDCVHLCVFGVPLHLSCVLCLFLICEVIFVFFVCMYRVR